MRLLILLALSLNQCSPATTNHSPWTYPPAPTTSNQGGKPYNSTIYKAAYKQIETINTPKKTVTNSQSNGSNPVAPNRPHLEWPLDNMAITSLFGPRKDPIRGKPSFHYGVDLEAAYGAIVYSAAPGKVIYAGWNKGHGRQIIIEHVHRYRTKYSHLSQILVFAHDTIQYKQPIGRAGNSGRSTGTHLHFELHYNDLHLDPLDHFGRALSPHP